MNILDTHYGAVRYLYAIFRKRNNQFDDLQNQQLFLKPINKYLSCTSGQYMYFAQLYLQKESEEIEKHFRTNRLATNIRPYEWMSYCDLITAPKVIPQTINGPYMIDNMRLRSFSYFYGTEYQMVSDIIATPFYCLDGIDFLYQETAKLWQLANDYNIALKVKSKHIYHDVFYIIEVTVPERGKISWLCWLDDVDVKSELYVQNNENVQLLKRLYVACNNNSYFLHIINTNETDNGIMILNVLFKNLSENFIVTHDNRPPSTFRTLVLNLDSPVPVHFPFSDNLINFTFNHENENQIYAIENLKGLHIETFSTPYVLMFQQEFIVHERPTQDQMIDEYVRFLELLNSGIIDDECFIRLLKLPNRLQHFAKPLQKRYNIVYIQHFRHFPINRQNIEWDAPFFERSYVFNSKHINANVKSISYIINTVLKKSNALLPGCCYLTMLKTPSSAWHRVTQNVIFHKNIKTFSFLKNFTLQENYYESPNSLAAMTSLNTETLFVDDVKTYNATIVSELEIVDQLRLIFTSDLSNESILVATFEDINLRCFTVDSNCRLEVFVFCKPTTITSDIDTSIQVAFKGYLHRFIQSTQATELNKKLYAILLHMYSLYENNFIT